MVLCGLHFNESRTSYNVAYERVTKLATLILGGGGGAGVHALGKIGERSDLFQVLPRSFLAIWWTGVAAILMLRGSKSRDVDLGANSLELRKIYNEELAGLGTSTNANDEALQQPSGVIWMRLMNRFASTQMDFPLAQRH
jgi:hypothetical protein